MQGDRLRVLSFYSFVPIVRATEGNIVISRRRPSNREPVQTLALVENSSSLLLGRAHTHKNRVPLLS
jgi:hypothetical protein